MFMNARINGRMIRMKVDTGANSTSLNSAEWFRLATSCVASTNIQAIVDVNRFTTNSVQRELRLECRLGDVIQKDFPIRYLGRDDNLLGMDFFQHYIVTFDFKMGKAYFEDWAAHQASEAIGAQSTPQPQR